MSACKGRPTYHVAVAVAGAAMGGVYSAGVLDFLLQALRESEAARQRGDPDAAPWDLRVTDVVGTSSGGLAAALAVSALTLDYEPLRHDFDPEVHQPPKNNPLYDFWIKNADAEAFLNIDDLRKKTPKQRRTSRRQRSCHSCCASPNEDGRTSDQQDGNEEEPIQDEAPKSENPRLRSAASADAMRTLSRNTLRWQWPNRSMPEFAEGVRLTLTTTNLQGVPYSTGMATTAAEYYHLTARAHSDHLTFDTGADKDGNTEFALDARASRSSLQWRRVVDTMAATSAFPGVLGAQLVSAPRSFYDNRYPADTIWNSEETSNEQFYAVDGFFRSKPYDLAEEGLQRYATIHKDACATQCSVLLIDAFPPAPVGQRLNFNRESNSNQDGQPPTFSETLLATWRAAKAQANFKHRLVTRALDERDHRIFLIAPWEDDPKLTSVGVFNTASVVHEKMRIYDFMRGRRDCQRFLRDSFTLPAEAAVQNSIFDGACAGQDGKVRIIPLCGTAKLECIEPESPRIPKRALTTAKRLLARRARTVLDVGARQSSLFDEAKWYQIHKHISNLARGAALSAAKSAAVSFGQKTFAEGVTPYLEDKPKTNASAK